ncbi:hypothetical protein B0E53_01042 [Micromonospora sp. MH33]|nr:hypothetical protein B0E53_01042 [Micromonospora sp. MH33]
MPFLAKRRQGFWAEVSGYHSGAAAEEVPSESAADGTSGSGDCNNGVLKTALEDAHRVVFSEIACGLLT